MKSTKPPACPIARSARLIGDEWIMLVLRSLFTGPKRFDDLQKQTTAATNILTNRLNKLIEADIVAKTLYQEHPPRFNYKLTRAGVSLFPLMMELIRFGDDWLPAEESTQIKLRHLDCGNITRAGQTCSECGGPITVKTVTIEPNP